MAFTQTPYENTPRRVVVSGGYFAEACLLPLILAISVKPLGYVTGHYTACNRHQEIHDIRHFAPPFLLPVSFGAAMTLYHVSTGPAISEKNKTFSALLLKIPLHSGKGCDTMSKIPHRAGHLAGAAPPGRLARWRMALEGNKLNFWRKLKTWQALYL